MQAAKPTKVFSDATFRKRIHTISERDFWVSALLARKDDVQFIDGVRDKADPVLDNDIAGWHSCPNSYMRDFPVVLHLGVRPVAGMPLDDHPTAPTRHSDFLWNNGGEGEILAWIREARTINSSLPSQPNMEEATP